MIGFDDTDADDAGRGNLAERETERAEAIADLKRKFRRAQLAMSFLPATELARHLGLPESGIANRLIGDTRLAQRIYWSLVDQEKVPDLTALPAHGPVSLIDSHASFENACACIEAAVALRETGPSLPRDEVKQLAQRFGDARLKWLWANRDIWAHEADEVARPDDETGAGQRRRRPDSARLLVMHLAGRVPEIAAWMGRDTDASLRRPVAGPDARLVERLVERLISGAGPAANVH